MDNELIKRYIENISNTQKYHTIVIEFSEGLKEYASNMYDEIQHKIKKGLEVFLNGNPRFGSCDIDIMLYDRIKPDLVIHLGHTPFPYICRTVVSKKQYDIHYIPIYEEVDDINWITDALLETKYHKIILVSSVQFIPVLKRIYLSLKKNVSQKIFYIPKIHGLAEGQIIGCFTTYLKRYRELFDSIYVISSGYFHALGVALYSGMDTYLIDLRKREVISMRDEVRRIKSLIAWNIYRAIDCKTFGVLVSKNPIQRWVSHYRTIMNILKKHNKRFIKIYIDRIKEETINLFSDIEAFISAACPRISIDDINRFKKPILNLEQLLILFGYREFGDVYP